MNIVKRRNAEFPSIFDELFQTDWLGGTTNPIVQKRSVPAVNIIETDDNYALEVAAPGKSKEDFKLSLDHDLLTISTEAKKEETEKKDNYTRKEFSFSAFKRSFELPKTVNKEEINATYTNGILHVTLPKREEDKVKPKRLIEIL